MFRILRQYESRMILHASQQQAAMLVLPPTFGAVSFTKPFAFFAFSKAPGTSFAKLKAPSLLPNK